MFDNNKEQRQLSRAQISHGRGLEVGDVLDRVTHTAILSLKVFVFLGNFLEMVHHRKKSNTSTSIEVFVHNDIGEKGISIVRGDNENYWD